MKDHPHKSPSFIWVHFLCLGWTVSQQTDTRNNTTATLKYIVMLGLFSEIISSLHSSIHPPEIEVDPPKTACGCPFGGTVKKNSHTCSLWNATVNVQLHFQGALWVFSWGTLPQQDHFFLKPLPSYSQGNESLMMDHPSFNDRYSLWFTVIFFTLVMWANHFT